MILKYQNYCRLRERQGSPFLHYPDYCAALISATWKGYLVRTLYHSFQEKTQNIEPSEKSKIESWVKNQIEIRGTLRASEQNAALLIQKMWKAHYVTFTNLRIRGFIDFIEI
jgi:hypothetical protein